MVELEQELDLDRFWLLNSCYQRQEIKSITRDGIDRHGEASGHQNLNCNGKPGLDAVLCRASICGVSLANIPRAYESPWTSGRESIQVGRAISQLF